MALARLLAPLAQLDDVAGYVNDHSVVVGCTDADTVIAVATLRDRVTRPLGLWLVLSEDYSAQIAARDVATLSWLLPLDHVVIEQGVDAPAHADVVRALLTNDEVNITNEVATIRAAYNRPAPPTTIDVWSFNGAELRLGETVLRASSNESLAFGERTDFE
jgi:hypothetical protein